MALRGIIGSNFGAIKEHSIKNSFIGGFLTQELQNKILKTGLSNEKFWSRAMRHSAGSNFTGEYPGEFKTEFENIGGC
jgi:hypothetical protein